MVIAGANATHTHGDVWLAKPAVWESQTAAEWELLETDGLLSARKQLAAVVLQVGLPGR